MQKTYLAASVVLASIVGLLTVPIMARNLGADQMAAVSVILLLNALLGMADVLRPVFIRGFIEHHSAAPPITVRHALRLSLRVGALVSAIVLIAGLLLLDRYFDPSTMALLAVGTLFFFLSITFWAVLDSTHRVGTAQLVRASAIALLYLSYSGLSLAGRPLLFFAITFAVIQAILLLGFVVLTHRDVSWNDESPPAWRPSEVYDTLQVNLAKILIDFSDRLVFARALPAQLFAGYAITYELATKVNIVPQYANNYLYPRLCAAAADGTLSRRLPRHLVLAIANFGILASLAMIISPFAGRLLGIYAGAAYAEYGYLLTYLLFVSGMYSLAFYGQSSLRAVGNFRGLARSFNISAVLGIVFGAIAWAVWGIHALVVCVVFLKTPGVGAMLRLAETHLSRSAAIVMLAGTSAATALVTWLAFRTGALAAFAAAGILLISVWIWRVLTVDNPAEHVE